jgi:uroporphyrinogen-III synthase
MTATPQLRALVTRPRLEAQDLAAALSARGIEPVIEPLIEIVERGGLPLDLAGVQAILCTSANGVRALARVTAERGVPLFAVGDRTAARARAEGFARVDSAGGAVEDLAALVRRRLDPRAGTLLHVAGSAVAGDLAAMLAADGFAVERIALYEARPAAALTPETARLIADGLIGLALFFSPRTAAIFARLATAADITDGLRAALALSISAAADAALADLPFRGRLAAAAPTQAALLDLVDRQICERCA